MKRTLPIVFCQFLLLPCGQAVADVVTLKDGSQISGPVESGGIREIRIKVADDSTQVVPVDQIQSIQFDSPTGFQPLPPPPPPPLEMQSIPLPAGTQISIRTIDALDSKTADEYKEYKASVDDAVVVGGVTVVPAKSNAFLRVAVTKAHIVSLHPTSAVLSIRLVALTINGQRIELNTTKVESKGAAHTKRDAAVGAGTGAAFGAVFGGGLGALAGAGVGAIGGVVFDKVTGHVKIQPETRFTYTLPEPVTISYPGAAR